MAARQSDVLLEVALQLGATLDLEPLLRLVVRRVAELVGAERALIALCDERGRVERAVVHNLAWPGVGHPLPVSERVMQKALRDRAPVLVTDAATDEVYHSHSSVKRLGLRLVGCVPVLARERILGVMYVDSQVKVLPDLHSRLELLTALSRVVATAVENAQLFEEQRYRTRILEELVHDFRTPLSVIMANAQLLVDDQPADGDERREMARDIEASAERTLLMVNGALEIARVGTGGLPPPVERVDVGKALKRHVRKLSAAARHRAVALRASAPEGLPCAHTRAEWLFVVLDNLIFNALKFADANTTVEVSVSLRDDAGPRDALERPAEDSTRPFRGARSLAARVGARFIEVAVANDGPAIPAELLPRVFHAYVRGEQRDRGEAPSTGLGLAIVDQCVRHLGGLVWADARARGACFRFTLPTDLDAF